MQQGSKIAGWNINYIIKAKLSCLLQIQIDDGQEKKTILLMS